MSTEDAGGGGLDGSDAGDGPGTAMQDTATTLADGSGGVPDGQAGADGPSAVIEDAMPGFDGGEMADANRTAGQAVGKLCHELNRGGAPVTLTLEIGDSPGVRISALTGHCAPPAGTPCPVIPAGEVPVRLLEGDRLLVTRTVVLMNGGEYVFQPIIDQASLQVVVTGGRIAAGTCQTLDFPTPDAGLD